MGIQLISVSYQHASLLIREKFSLTKEEQGAMLKELVQTKEIREAVFISTCNRTELYCYGEDGSSSREIFATMQTVLRKATGLEACEEVVMALRFYQDQKASHHLFQVAAGLDSMVIGEDQILGQVKDAHEYAMQLGTTGIYLNTLFRYAVTGAKKVKTETNLSKTSVSVASLAIKQAIQDLDGLDGKKVMVIGASGKTGTILVKNMISMKNIEVYATVRKGKLKHNKTVRFHEIPYEERYEWMDEMDVIMSATLSPHYTVTKQRFLDVIQTQKERVMIDLAVPMDLEATLGDIEGISYYNIDDFLRISQDNNEKKQKEVSLADFILDEYEEKFEQWRLFQDYSATMEQIYEFMKREDEKKGMEHAIWKLFYQVRDSVEPEGLEQFFQCLEKRNQKYE